MLQSLKKQSDVLGKGEPGCGVSFAEGYFQKSMLFLLIVSQAVLEVQKREPLEADEAWEALLQEVAALVAKLDAANVFTRVLLEIAKNTPFTSQSLKNRVVLARGGHTKPAAPLLSLRALFLPRPLPHLPAYTLYALAVALPFRLQSFYINDLDALPHVQRLSFATYFQLFVTPAVAAQPVADINALLAKYEMEDASASCDGTRVVLTIHTGVTELRICFCHSELYPLNATTVGAGVWREA